MHTLVPILYLLAAGIAAVVLSRRLGMSPIVGYLIAGAVLGEHGIGLIETSQSTHFAAELGVVFLLFDIGLHFTAGQVWTARREIFVLGSLQLLFCGGLFAGVLILLELPLAYALAVGVTLALSSTAVAVQSLREDGRSTSPVGTTAVSVLIFQDLAAIFLLIFVDSLDDPTLSLTAALAQALEKSALAFAAALAAGRFLVGPILGLYARTRHAELFVAVALFVVLGAASATEALGLSLTLGAFLGGMIIAESRYRHVIETEVRPFRALFLGFFFISVGMGIDGLNLLPSLPLVLAVLTVALAIKATGIFVAARLLGFERSPASQLTAYLMQGSEFAFVLLAAPALANVVGDSLSNAVITSVALSMVLTPLLVRAAQRWDRSSAEQMVNDRPSAPAHVIVFGVSSIGCRVLDALRAHGVSYFAIDIDYDAFVEANRSGYSVAYGDPANLNLMEAIEIAKADAFVITRTRLEVSQTLTPLIAERYPDLARYVSVTSEAEGREFESLGMIAVHDTTVPSGVNLAAAVLGGLGIEHDRVAAWVEAVHQDAIDALAENQ